MLVVFNRLTRLGQRKQLTAIDLSSEKNYISHEIMLSFNYYYYRLRYYLLQYFSQCSLLPIQAQS